MHFFIIMFCKARNEVENWKIFLKYIFQSEQKFVKAIMKSKTQQSFWLPFFSGRKSEKSWKITSAEGEKERSIFRSTPRSTNYKAHTSFPPISGEESDVSPREAQSPFRLSSFQHSFLSHARTRWQSEDNFTHCARSR